MNKKVIFYLLLAFCLLGLQSCLKDEKEVFDKSAAARLDEAVAQTKAHLESAENGWKLYYYAGRDYSNKANTLLFKFKDGHVVMMGDNLGPEVTDTSSYSVVKDQGLVLSIDTYNSIIHPLTEASLGRPEGEQGDYEFVILRQTTDTLYLRGKRWRNDMILTRMKAEEDWLSYMAELYELKDAMSANTFHFIIGTDTLAEGTIDATSTKLRVSIENKQYNVPFSFDNKGIVLQSPILVKGKEYSSFIWNTESNSFTSGDLMASMFIPKGYKPIDFWYGTWSVGFTNTSRSRVNISITFTPGDGKTFIRAAVAITVMQGRQRNTTTYNMLFAYNAATGTINVGAQGVTDPTGRFAGGIRLVPLASSGNSAELAEDGEVTFKWDEEIEQAVLVAAEGENRVVDNLVGFGLADNLSVIIGENGEPLRAFFIPKITELRNHRPLENP